MTAVKHPFECPEPNRYRRFKLENLLEQTSFKVTRFCQSAVNPTRHPRTPLPSQPRQYALPAHARWFDFKRIHDIERDAFPELRDSCFEVWYRRVRNRAVKLFRLYPTFPVTVSTLRHMHGGDVCAIGRIHEFLSTWGLINFISTFRDAPSNPDPSDSRLVSEFSGVVEGAVLNAVASAQKAHLDVLCSICRSGCADGHFLSRKYPGIVICPLCFSHHNTLDQLEASHASFEFRSLPQPKSVGVGSVSGFGVGVGVGVGVGGSGVGSGVGVGVGVGGSVRAPSEYETDKLMFDAFEKTKGDWMSISEGCKRSPLDCMISIVRNSFSDMVSQSQFLNHEFDDCPVLNELLSFCGNPNDTVSAESGDASADVCARDLKVEYRTDWHEVEGEVSLMEEEVRACLSK